MDRGQLRVDNPSASLHSADPFTQGSLAVQEAEKASVKALADAFRESLRPFGLDRFLLSDAPDRVITLPDGRMLAEFRTMMFPVWYPQKLNELAAAGIEVVTVTKKYKKHPPQLMYYVRSVHEIGGNYGNQ